MTSGGSDSGETRRTHPFARHGYQTAINANAKETTHGAGPRQSDFGEIPIVHLAYTHATQFFRDESPGDPDPLHVRIVLAANLACPVGHIGALSESLYQSACRFDNTSPLRGRRLDGLAHERQATLSSAVSTSRT